MFSLIATSAHAQTVASTPSSLTALQAQIEILKEKLSQLVKIGSAGFTSTINSSAVEVGDRIAATANVNVRTLPGVDGEKVGTAAVGAQGTVIAGPAKMVDGVITTMPAADSFSFWQIKYDNGLTGWSSVLYVRDIGSTYGGDTSNPATCSSFTFTPSSVKKGEQTTATWSVANADRIVLINSSNQVVKNFTTENSYTFTPEKTGLYVIRAYGKNNTQVSCAATIVVNTVVTSVGTTSAELAQCNSFKLSPAAAKKGDAVTLSWDVTNASKVYLSNTLTGSSTQEHSPVGSISLVADKAVMYTLSVDGVKSKRVLCSANLTVQDVATAATQPICNSFLPTKSTIANGSSTVLTWDTTNARYTTLTSNGLEQKSGLPADGSWTVSPKVSTDYILYVFGSDGKRVSCATAVKVNR